MPKYTNLMKILLCSEPLEPFPTAIWQCARQILLLKPKVHQKNHQKQWTVLPMLSQVIATVHQLAMACKNYKGIILTDKDGNVIDNTNDVVDDYYSRNRPTITGVEDHNTLGITVVDDNEQYENMDTNATQENEHTQQYDMETNNVNEQYNDNKDYNHDISIEMESPDNVHV